MVRLFWTICLLHFAFATKLASADKPVVFETDGTLSSSSCDVESEKTMLKTCFNNYFADRGFSKNDTSQQYKLKANLYDVVSFEKNCVSHYAFIDCTKSIAKHCLNTETLLTIGFANVTYAKTVIADLAVDDYLCNDGYSAYSQNFKCIKEVENERTNDLKACKKIITKSLDKRSPCSKFDEYISCVQYVYAFQCNGIVGDNRLNNFICHREEIIYAKNDQLVCEDICKRDNVPKPAIIDNTACNVDHQMHLKQCVVEYFNANGYYAKNMDEIPTFVRYRLTKRQLQFNDGIVGLRSICLSHQKLFNCIESIDRQKCFNTETLFAIGVTNGNDALEYVKDWNSDAYKCGDGKEWYFRNLKCYLEYVNSDDGTKCDRQAIIDTNSGVDRCEAAMNHVQCLQNRYYSYSYSCNYNYGGQGLTGSPYSISDFQCELETIAVKSESTTMNHKATKCDVCERIRYANTWHPTVWQKIGYAWDFVAPILVILLKILLVLGVLLVIFAICVSIKRNPQAVKNIGSYFDAKSVVVKENEGEDNEGTTHLI